MSYIERKGRQIRFLNVDSITHDQWSEMLRKINYLGYGIPDTDDLKSYFEKQPWLNEDQSQVALEVLHGIYTPDLTFPQRIVTDILNDAKEFFGTTRNWNVAGYLLQDGTMLDFSDGQPIRSIDHRSIYQILERHLHRDIKPREGMDLFMNLGNIRLQNNSMDIIRPMTPEQKTTIAEYINNKPNPDFYVDISNKQGMTVESFHYEIAQPMQVFFDLENFFDTCSIKPTKFTM